MRAVEALNAGYVFPSNVRLMDGGTQGMFLLANVRETQRLLLFDAIDFGLPGGELKVIHDADVPKYMGAKKVSMHQTGFQEVLATAELLGDYPERLALIGVQPVVLDDYGGSLRPQVKACIPAALHAALSVLRKWGIEVNQRKSPLSPSDRINPMELDIVSYERDRPRAAQDS